MPRDARAQARSRTIAPKLERAATPLPRHEELERRLLHDPDLDPDLWSVYADWILDQGHPSGAWLAFTGEARARVLADSAGVVAEVLSWQQQQIPALEDWLEVEWFGPFPARLRVGALSNDDLNLTQPGVKRVAHLRRPKPRAEPRAPRRV